MPGFDGTGPQGKGPLTGRGLGYCVLRESSESVPRIEGWAGIDGVPVADATVEHAEPEKEVIEMPFGDGTGPGGIGPIRSNAARFGAGSAGLGYRHPASVRGYVLPYNVRRSGYALRYGPPYAGWLGQWVRRGFGFARGFGFGRGRRGGRPRCGYRW